jgi:hypothetical protein
MRVLNTARLKTKKRKHPDLPPNVPSPDEPVQEEDRQQNLFSDHEDPSDDGSSNSSRHEDQKS